MNRRTRAIMKYTAIVLLGERSPDALKKSRTLSLRGIYNMLSPALHKSTWELREMPNISAQYRAIVMLHRNSLLVGSRSGLNSSANPLYNSISVGLG